MTFSRRRALGALGPLLLAGCAGRVPVGGGSPEPTAVPTDRAPSVTEVSLLLNWKPSGLHAPYYAAAAEGFYADEGLDLTAIKSGQGSDFAATQAGLGNETFTVTSADQVLNVNSRELAPLSVGVVMQQSPVVVFTVRDQFGDELTDVDQLAGATIGTGPGMVRLLTTLLLEHHGVRRDVELVDTGYDTVQQVLTGDIDAAGGVFGDVIDARYHDATVDSIPVASAIPSYGHVLATSTAFAGEHPATVRAFLRATARGVVWAGTNPAAATDHLVDAVPALEESRERQRDRWELMFEEFVRSETVHSEAWGWSRPDPWTTMADALADADLLGGPVDAGSVWTNEHLDTADEYVGGFGDRVEE